jgi:hypothetical protein
MYQLGEKNLVDSVAVYGRGREIFRPPTYIYEVKYSLPVIVR